MSKELTKEETQISLARIIDLAKCGLHHNYPHQDDLHKDYHDEFNRYVSVVKEYSAQKQKRIDELEKIINDYTNMIDLKTIQIEGLVNGNRVMRESLSTAVEALDRISNTYDNLEDLAGVIAKETLQKINKK